MTRGHYSHMDKYNPGKNDVTGDSLRTKPPSDSFRENFERIFGVAKSGPNHLGEQNVSDDAGNTSADRLSGVGSSNNVA